MQVYRTLSMLTLACISVFATVANAADVVPQPIQQEMLISSPLGGVKLFRTEYGSGIPGFGSFINRSIHVSVPEELHFNCGNVGGTAFYAPIAGLHVALPTMSSGWRGSRIAETEASNPITRTLHSISQFYGHSPSQSSMMRREEMHGRSLHLHVRF